MKKLFLISSLLSFFFIMGLNAQKAVNPDNKLQKKSPDYQKIALDYIREKLPEYNELVSGGFSLSYENTVSISFEKILRFNYCYEGVPIENMIILVGIKNDGIPIYFKSSVSEVSVNLFNKGVYNESEIRNIFALRSGDRGDINLLNNNLKYEFNGNSYDLFYKVFAKYPNDRVSRHLIYNVSKREVIKYENRNEVFNNMLISNRDSVDDEEYIYPTGNCSGANCSVAPPDKGISNLNIPDPDNSNFYCVDNFPVTLYASRYQLGNFNIVNNKLVLNEPVYYYYDDPVNILKSVNREYCYNFQKGEGVNLSSSSKAYLEVFTYKFVKSLIFDDVIDADNRPDKVTLVVDYPTTNPQVSCTPDFEIFYSIKNGVEPAAADLFLACHGGAQAILKNIKSELGEPITGSADYIAQSYRWNVIGITDPNCFSWNAGSDPRRTDYDETYKHDPTKGNQIWATIFMKIEAIIGRGRAHDLLFKTVAQATGFQLKSYPHLAALLYSIVSDPLSTQADNLNLSSEQQFLVSSLILDKFETISKNPDYWIKDSEDDIGNEPNSSNSQLVLGSPDIWNSDTPNGLTFTVPQYGKKNFLRVRIRNKGNYVQNNATLRLYWSRVLSSNKWPDDWVKNLPFGNEINTNNGLSLGNIYPGKDSIYTIEWTDQIPNPYDYGDHNLNLSILARITESNDLNDSNGFVYDHNGAKESTGLFSTYDNITNFNGIALKNMYISYIDEIPQDSIDEIRKLATIWIKADEEIENSNESIPVSFALKINQPPNNNGNNILDDSLTVNQDKEFFNKSEIFIRPDKDLKKIIFPNGLNFRSDTIWNQITKEGAFYSEIVLEANKYYSFDVGFRLKDSTNNSSFSIIQKDNNNHILGGITINILKTKPFSVSIIDLNNNLEKIINIYPNPVSQGGELTVVTPEGLNIEDMSIYNLKGELLHCEETVGNEGILNIGFLPPGMYLVKIGTKEYDYMEKVVVGD